MPIRKDSALKIRNFNSKNYHYHEETKNNNIIISLLTASSS